MSIEREYSLASLGISKYIYIYINRQFSVYTTSVGLAALAPINIRRTFLRGLDEVCQLLHGVSQLLYKVHLLAVWQVGTSRVGKYNPLIFYPYNQLYMIYTVNLICTHAVRQKVRGVCLLRRPLVLVCKQHAY